jgi:hypothetical protein
MGYRSDVAVAIYGDDRSPEKYETLKLLMNTTFKDVNDENDADWHDSKCVLMFQARDVKWYESYPEVSRFMKMLDEIGELEGFNYEFLRIGEDDDDIERKIGGENCDCILSVSRAIEVDL